MKRSAKCLFALVLGVLLLAVPGLTLADSNINDGCTIEVTGEGDVRTLTDNTYNSVVTMGEGQGFSVTWTPENPVAALYWEWLYIPEAALIEQLDEGGQIIWSEERGNEIRFLTIFPEEQTRTIRMTVTRGQGSMAELFAYSEKQVQPKAITWLPPYDKADILLVEGHGKDDVFSFGGILPVYVDKGLQMQIVDVSCDTIGRQRKSLPGSHLNGMTHYKVFLGYPDYHTYTYGTIQRRWAEYDANLVGHLVEQIRRFKPEVVVTHDIENGEFNHGAHILIAEATQEAIQLAADPAQYPESAEKYGAWQVKKLYFHLYSENQIRIDIDAPLASFDGKTGFELAKEGYQLWEPGKSTAYGSLCRKQYDPGLYGLAFSTVGADVNCDDFMENIPAEDRSDYVPPTPSPTPEPTPTPTPSPTPVPTNTPAPTEAPTPEPTPEPEAPAASGVGIPVLCIAIGAALAAGILLGRRSRKNK